MQYIESTPRRKNEHPLAYHMRCHIEYYQNVGLLSDYPSYNEEDRVAWEKEIQQRGKRNDQQT